MFFSQNNSCYCGYNPANVQLQMLSSREEMENYNHITKLKAEIEKIRLNEQKELRKDIETLLNIYINNREMTNKEIKRFSERYFNIIEKQNAKKTLKQRSE